MDDDRRTMAYDGHPPEVPAVDPEHVPTRREEAVPELPRDQRPTALEHDHDAVRSRVEAAVAATESSTRETQVDPMLGTTIGGRFQVVSRIGAGGMGVVYRARQLGMDRDVAIKMLHRELAHDEKVVSRFKIEALAVSRLNHPNTIRIFDFGQLDDGTLYFAMEFLEGSSLERALRDGVFSARRTLHVVRQIAHSLTEAHDKGIVHRDLKPDNVYLTRVGGDADFVKVLDFGVAKLREADKRQGTLTQAGMIFGTPRYMAPEQCRSMAVDHRADVYAIGVMAYEMLTGQAPFDAENPLGILIKHVQEPPRSLAEIRPDVEVPDEVEALVMRCLAKVPGERFQTASELAAEVGVLEAKLAGRYEHVVFVEGPRRPTTAVQQEARTMIGSRLPRWRWKAWAVLGALALAGVIAAGLWMAGVLGPGSDPRTSGEGGSPPSAMSAPSVPAPVPAPAASPATAAPVADQPTTVSLRFESEPAGAEVVRDGEVLGVTPLARTFPADAQVGMFLLRKAGFVEREVSAAMDRDASISVALKALPATRVRPAAVSPSAGTPAAPAAPKPKPSDDGMGRIGDLKKMEF